MNNFEKQVITAVNDLAAENPDFVYRTRDYCKYTTGADGKGCLIGQALIRANPLLEKPLRDIDEYLSGPVPLEELNTRLELGISEPVLNWLSVVQIGQDQGSTWHTALVNAEEIKPKSFLERFWAWILMELWT